MYGLFILGKKSEKNNSKRKKYTIKKVSTRSTPLSK